MQFRHHLLAFIGAAILCLLLANPISLAYILIGTFGVGLLAAFPLVNGTFYYGLALPGLYLIGRPSNAGRSFATKAAMVLALPAFVAFAGPVLSYASERYATASTTAGDHETERPVLKRPAAITLLSQGVTKIDGQYLPVCSPLCQKLLAADYAEKIISVDGPSRRRKKPRVLVYSLRQGHDCPALLPTNKQATTEFLKRRANGECLTARPAFNGEREADGYVIERARPLKRKDLPSNITYLRQLVIKKRENNVATEVLRRTHVKSERLVFPTYWKISFRGTHGFPSGWEQAVLQEQKNEFDPDDFVMDFFGQPPPKSATEPARRSTRVGQQEYALILEKLFASPQTRAFEPGVRQIVNSWMSSTPRAPQPQFDAMLVRIAKDRRFVDIPLVFTNLRNRPAALKEALPAMIERLESPPPAGAEMDNKRQSYDFDRAHISYALRNLKPRDLAPFADRLFALVQGEPAPWTAGIIAILPRLGHDHAAVLERALSSGSNEIRRRAGQAACRSPLEILQQVRPAVMTAFENATHDRRAIAIALLRMGETEFVESRLKSDRERARVFHGRSPPHTSGFNDRHCDT